MSGSNSQDKTMATAELFTMILSRIEDKELLLKAPLVSHFWKNTIDKTPEIQWRLFKAVRRQEVPMLPIISGFPNPDWNRLTCEPYGIITDKRIRLMIYHAMKRIDPSMTYFYDDLTKWYSEMTDDEEIGILPRSDLPEYLSTASWLSMYISQPPPKVAKLFLAPPSSGSNVSFDFTIRNPQGITWDDVVEHLKDEITQWYSGASVQARQDELDEDENVKIFHQLSLLFEAVLTAAHYFGVFVISGKGLTPQQKMICHQLAGVHYSEALYELETDEQAEFPELF
jgi:hypothetical protein